MLRLHNALPNRYKYNGKELYSDFGLEWLDYGARFYDPQLATWHVQDPMAENRYWLSPYQYAQNNPIVIIDVDGMLDDWWLNMNTGKTEYIENKKNWDQDEMKQKGYLYLGEFKITNDIYSSLPKIFNYYQDLWTQGWSYKGYKMGYLNLGGKAYSGEGSSDGANTGYIDWSWSGDDVQNTLSVATFFLPVGFEYEAVDVICKAIEGTIVIDDIGGFSDNIQNQDVKNGIAYSKIGFNMIMTGRGLFNISKLRTANINNEVNVMKNMGNTIGGTDWCNKCTFFAK